MLQALWLARQNSLGNVEKLQENIESLLSDRPSELGFKSVVPIQEMRTGSITLDQEDEHAIDALESLDQEFFAYQDNLTELLFDYVRARSSVFGPIDGQ